MNRNNIVHPLVQNIMSTVNLGCKLDLKNIALRCRNVEYNPHRFPALIMRLREPRTTALIYSSGKMVVTGSKSEIESKTASRKFARIIQKLGYDAKLIDFQIQNVVGSTDMGYNLNLEMLQITHYLFTCYEPELFPGLIYRLRDPNCVILIFKSGKIVITGAKSEEILHRAFQKICPNMISFKK